MGYYRDRCKDAAICTDWWSGERAALSVLFVVFRFLFEHWAQGAIVTLWSLVLIALSGIAAYAVLCGMQFAWQFVWSVGTDQYGKQTAIADLQNHVRSLLNPELPEKSQRAIAMLERRIQEADTVFNTPPIEREKLNGWTIHTEFALQRIIGRSSDWFEKFANGVQSEPITADRNFDQVLLMRRVAVLRTVIDEIQHQSVLVLDPKETLGIQR